MYLNRKLSIDIQKLDKQRKLPSVSVIHIFSDHTFQISLHKFTYRIAGKPPVLHDGINTPHVRKLPTLAEYGILAQHSLISLRITLHKLFVQSFCQRLSTPRFPHCCRNETERI